MASRQLWTLEPKPVLLDGRELAALPLARVAAITANKVAFARRKSEWNAVLWLGGDCRGGHRHDGGSVVLRERRRREARAVGRRISGAKRSIAVRRSGRTVQAAQTGLAAGATPAAYKGVGRSSYAGL